MTKIISENWLWQGGGRPHTKVAMLGKFGVDGYLLFSCPIRSCSFSDASPHNNRVEVTENELADGTLWCNGTSRGIDPVGYSS